MIDRLKWLTISREKLKFVEKPVLENTQPRIKIPLETTNLAVCTTHPGFHVHRNHSKLSVKWTLIMLTVRLPHTAPLLKCVVQNCNFEQINDTSQFRPNIYWQLFISNFWKDHLMESLCVISIFVR